MFRDGINDTSLGVVLKIEFALIVVSDVAPVLPMARNPVNSWLILEWKDNDTRVLPKATDVLWRIPVLGKCFKMSVEAFDKPLGIRKCRGWVETDVAMVLKRR
jgi:hypothetical protein